LQRAQNYIKNIIDSMPSVLVGLDAEEKITHWNLEAEKSTGLTADQARGRTLESTFPKLIYGMRRVRKAIRERRPLREDKIPYQADGETRFSAVTVYPLMTNGVEGSVIRVDDVTERVRIEEMMIQSEKMMSVGGLAAGMAHEINNPLAGILQSIQVVLERVFADLPANRSAAKQSGTSIEVIRDYLDRRQITGMLEMAKDSGQRAAKIVENMLSFSRKSDTKLTLNDLPALLDQTIELAASDYDLKKKYDFRNIEIRRHYEPDLPPVLCEKTKIQQVILNLLKNGAQAMVEQEDRRRPARFIVRVRQRGNMVQIEIEDNGPGMTESVRRRVFEPFFTTKGVAVGTGLGLSVSYFIITEDHGGTMRVESTPGQGAKFVIRLPLERDTV